MKYFKLKKMSFYPHFSVNPNLSLKGWMLWCHQLQRKANRSLAVRKETAALAPFALMEGVLSPLGATGDPTSLVFPCNHSNFFFSVAVNVWETEEQFQAFWSQKEQEYTSHAPWVSTSPIMRWSCSQTVYAFKDRPNHSPALNGKE